MKVPEGHFTYSSMLTTPRGIRILRRWADQKTQPIPHPSHLDKIEDDHINDEQITLQVTEVYRYIELGDYCYDLTLCDGAEKAKVTLLPSKANNHLIQTEQVTRGSFVQVPRQWQTMTNVVNCYNDTHKGNKVVVVGQIVWESTHPQIYVSNYCQSKDGVCKPAFAMGTPATERQRLPLLSSRKFYLDKWTDSIVINSAFENYILTPDKITTRYPVPPTYRSMAESIQIGLANRGNRGSYIVARIVRKASVHCFARPPSMGGRSDAMPIVFQLILADVMGDQATQVVLSVWNQHVMELYNLLHVGQIVQVDGYKTKLMKDKENPSLENGGVELALNYDKTSSASIRICGEGALQQWNPNLIESRFPLPRLRLVPIGDLPMVKDGTEVEVQGIVSWVGQIERERRSQLSEYRWIFIRDGTGGVAAKIYSGTSGGWQDELGCPRKIEVGSQVLLMNHHVESHGWSHSKSVLYSRATSQIYLWNGSPPAHFWFAPFVQELDFAVEGIEGGSFEPSVSYPSLAIRTNSMDEYSSKEWEKAMVDPIPLVEGLMKYERKCVIIEGSLIFISIPARNGETNIKLSTQKNILWTNPGPIWPGVLDGTTGYVDILPNGQTHAIRCYFQPSMDEEFAHDQDQHTWIRRCIRNAMGLDVDVESEQDLKQFVTGWKGEVFLVGQVTLLAPDMPRMTISEMYKKKS